MRVTDHRYSRDLVRFDLAMRMIQYEARTCTIRLCTGLTDDRIRKLYRSYLHGDLGAGLRRRRGKSPRQVAYFTRNTDTQLEASLLASIYTSLGLLRGRESTPSPTSSSRALEYGQLFCDAYEAYLQIWAGETLSFEHAWFLLCALAQGDELHIADCRRCRAPYVRDAYDLKMSLCPSCRTKHGAATARSRGAASTLSGDMEPPGAPTK